MRTENREIGEHSELAFLAPPPSGRGSCARQRNETLPSNGRSWGGQMSDLAGHAVSKVACHLFNRRGLPLLEGGANKGVGWRCCSWIFLALILCSACSPKDSTPQPDKLTIAVIPKG